MKKVIASILLILTAIFLVACNNTVAENSQITVNYSVQGGGTIVGKSTQSKELTGDFVVFDMVSAIPNEGYKFVGWSDGKAEASRQDSLNQNSSFVARFEEISMITATYVATEGGSIEGELYQASTNMFATSSVKAIPDVGYRFKGWDDGFGFATRQDIVDEDIVFTAIFEKIKYVTVNYTATEGGKIVGEATQTGEDKITTTAVEAVPDEGYGFYGWNDKKEGASRTDATTENKNIVAIFKKIYNVSFNCESVKGEIVGDSEQTVFVGEKTNTVTAKAKPGFKFYAWSDGNTKAARQVQPSDSLDLFAIFVRDSMEDLPLIVINTENNVPVISKEFYVSCSVSVDSKDYNFSFENAEAQIRGRGNTSWDSPKKPYRLKFTEKTDLFGNGAAKNWTLISNYTDLSLIRNYLAYSVAADFDSLTSTSTVEFVELYMNGEYLGVYLLCEQVEVHENRVNVTESWDSYDTGYLVELDARKDGVYFELDGKYYVVKDPDTDDIMYQEEYTNFIKSYMEQCLNALNGDDYSRVEELMDTKTFAQAYLVFEIFNCVDVGYASFFMHKDAGGKLCCGPVWDFDRSLGIVGNQHLAEPYDTLWAKDSNPWFNKLLAHEEFLALVVEQFASHWDTIFERLEACYEYVYSCKTSFERNFEKWDVFGTFVWPNSEEILSYDSWEKQVEYTRTYLNNSLNFLYEVYLQ